MPEHPLPRPSLAQQPLSAPVRPEEIFADLKKPEPAKHAPAPAAKSVPAGLWPCHGWLAPPRHGWVSFHADPVASRLPDRLRLTTSRCRDPEFARLAHWAERAFLAAVVEALFGPEYFCRRRRCRRAHRCLGFAAGLVEPPCLIRLHHRWRDALVWLLGLSLDMRAFAEAEGDLFLSDDPRRRALEDLAAGVIFQRPRPGHPGDVRRIRRFLRARAAAAAARPPRSQNDHESVIGS
ncbi:hypothetical protein [Rhizobium sp. SG2393]|uniref:hypothetical protein n=1 Tax=Rhizobium sp. SG2393 TaxID=3276279 RepID=UPI003671F211